MADAKVRFENNAGEEALPGQEAFFDFRCPTSGRVCGTLAIKGRVPDNGRHTWAWNGDRRNPTFSPSIDCRGCWHGYIENGRTVDCERHDEPEPEKSPRPVGAGA